MGRPLFDVSVNGVALNDKGLTDQNTTDPLSLLTNGFIWSCGNHWGPAGFSDVTLTTWTVYSAFGVTTSWTTYAGMTITTTWTDYLESGVEEC